MCGQPLDNSTTLDDQLWGATRVGHAQATPMCLQDAVKHTKSHLEECRTLAHRVEHIEPNIPAC